MTKEHTQEEHTPEEKLQQALHRAFRALPLRRAPGTLESRVLDELRRRMALPWWRASFAHWPAGARFAFVFICVALVGSTFFGGVAAFAGVRPWNEAAATLLSWGQPLWAAISSAGSLSMLLVRVIPPLWLYGGLIFGMALYLALFGLGAAAYRTLYLRPLAGNRT